MPAPLCSLPPPTKRRKLEKDSRYAPQVKKLEEDVACAVANNSSLNPLVDLLQLVCNVEDPQEVSKGIYALYRTFVLIITNGKLGLAGDEATKVVKAWLWERLNTYTDFLASLLQDEEKFLRTSALQILFSLQKHLSTAHSSSQPQFHQSHFHKIVSGLLTCPPSQRKGSGKKEQHVLDSDVLELFYETWLSVHDDIRWFFLRESVSILNNPSYVTKNLISVLERLTTFPTEQSELNEWWVAELGTKPPKPKRTSGNESSEDEAGDNGDNNDDEDDWRKFFEDEPAPSDTKHKSPGIRLHRMTLHQSLHSLASHKAVFTRAWLTLLPRLSSPDFDTETRKALAVRALNVLHRGVLPHLTRPVLTMDWIGGCVDLGGSVGLLALNGLFTLMRDYNLDYPSFYTRLYAFLDRDVLHLKHRSRFFRMTELFLSSTHLPATLLASFIKRLSRLSLSAPPAAIVMIVPFTYNTLKKHPALMTMLHRTDTDIDHGSYTDPFVMDESNPLLTHALDSSLWELYSHRNHYHASVSALCKVFAEAFTKPGYAMEDFLDHTYNTLFDTEVKRKIKREPPLAMETGGGIDLFPTERKAREGDKDEELSPTTTDVVNELWAF